MIRFSKLTCNLSSSICTNAKKASSRGGESVGVVDSIVAQRSAQPAELQQWHWIFLVDFSGSMRRCDVIDSDGEPRRRIDLVQEVVLNFVKRQFKEPLASRDKFSFLLFNTSCTSVFMNYETKNHGIICQRLKLKRQPELGTHYRVGLEEALELA